MKTLKNIAAATAKATDNELITIVDNSNVAIDTMTDDEKFSVMIYSELAKALKSKDYALLLDCNYSKSKNDVPVMTYFRLVDTSSNTSLVQFYNHCSLKAQTCFFRLATSCATVNRDRLVEECGFTVKVNHKTNKYKHSERVRVSYEEVVNVAKSVCAVLKNARSASDDGVDEE